MSTRAIVTLGLALMFGVSAAFLIRQAMFPQMKAAQQNQPTVEVVVAGVRIDRGKPLSKELLATRAVNKDSVPQGVYLAADMDQLYDQVAIMDLQAGEQIFMSKVGADISLRKEISPGMLAYTISTPNASSSNAGLLQPQDRVNVIFVPTGSGRSGSATLTLLHNMRIIATNREYLQRSPDDKRSFEQVQSVTLEVSREHSELLSWSQSRGTLSLALLSHQIPESSTPPDLTISDLQRTMGLAEPASEPKVTQVAAPNPDASDAQQAPTVRLLVPARAIPVGEQLSESALTTVERPAGDLPEGALLADDLPEIVGKQPLVALVRGETLFPSRFSQRRGSLSEFLSPGKRAYRIQADAGRLVAEDRVDVVYTPRDLKLAVTDYAENREAITLMNAVRVIVVNDKPQRSNKSMEEFESAKTVVLEVSPQEVELLSWAHRHGEIQLAIVPHVDESDGPSALTLLELKGLLFGQPETETEPQSTGQPAFAAADQGPVTVSINELRNRALGQTQLRLYP